MRLIPGTKATVLLDGEECCFTLVASGGDGIERLNVAAPLAKMLGAMAPGNIIKAWTPVRGAEAMRVELVEVEVMT